MKRVSKGLGEADLSAARDVAGRFLKAVIGQDEKTARGLLIIREGESLDFESMSSSLGSFTLGKAEAEGDVAVVVAAVKPKPGKDGPPALPLVIARDAGSWKVDMGASIQRMMGGVDLQALMEQMAQGLGEAMAQGMEGLGDALAEGLGGQVKGKGKAPKKSKAKAPVAKKATPAKGR